jgi:predicted esterase
LLLTAAIIACVAWPAAASVACPTVAYIGAAGSGELLPHKPTYHGMGAPVDKMADVVSSALAAQHLTFERIADKYPAEPTSDLYPSARDVLLSFFLPSHLKTAWAIKLHRYFASIDTGTTNAVHIVKMQLKQCPATQLVLAGYSQGAMVVHQAELKLAGNPAARRQIVGTLLLGDGDRVPKSGATRFGSAPARGEGVRVYMHMIHRKDVLLAGSTASICNADDVVCDFKLGHISSPSRIRKALKVHTTYVVEDKHGKARSYSPLLAQAANWLAARILAAHAQPPPPPPPPPPPTVPATGPTLVYDGGTAGHAGDGDTSFEDFSQATGESADVEDSLPASLYAYRCVVLDINTSFDAGQTAELAGYLQAGGTVLALGEHAGGGWDDADAALTALASAVSANGLSLNDDSWDDGDHVTTAIGSSPLTAGVGALGDNWASSVDVSEPAQTLVSAADDDSTALIASQTVGTGTLVMSGDSNFFSDNNNGFYVDDDNGQFAKDLCP